MELEEARQLLRTWKERKNTAELEIERQETVIKLLEAALNAKRVSADMFKKRPPAIAEHPQAPAKERARVQWRPVFQELLGEIPDVPGPTKKQLIDTLCKRYPEHSRLGLQQQVYSRVYNGEIKVVVDFCVLPGNEAAARKKWWPNG